MDCKDIFAGKRITVMGLGLLGRGVGDAEFLAKCGAQVLVTDKKSETELAESVAKLKQYSNITFKLGGHDINDFIQCDMVLKAAGVPLDSAEIAAARAANIPVVMSTALFAKYASEAGATIVGVTGTRGKSTTAQMIYEVLKAVGKKVLLGGNVRGISTLAMLPLVEKDTIVVLELDSWQLQGFGELEISPRIGVFTNFYPDHMNYYKGDMETYFADKANIFAHQKPGDTLIVGYDVQQRMLQSRFYPKSNVLLADMHDIVEWGNLTLLGNHNRQNAACAAKALQQLGVEEAMIQKALKTFSAVPGRLEFVREINRVKIYNDNNATTPEATAAGLVAVAGLVGNTQPIVLIMGGSDKGLNMDNLIHEANHIADKIILLQGTGTERIKDSLTKRKVVVDSLEQAVSESFKYLQSQDKGGIILFSPAFASFGMFKNEYERNDQFVALVKNL